MSVYVVFKKKPDSMLVFHVIVGNVPPIRVTLLNIFHSINIVWFSIM